VRGLRARLGSPGGAPAAEDGEVPGSIPLAADDEEKGDEEFSLEMEPEPGAGAAESGDGLPAVEPEPEAKEGLSEEADYGPVSKIQEIQAADGDGRPIDEDFISEHLTEADVFAKYGLLAKAREQLLAILERYPKEMSAHQRLIEVHTGEGNTEAAVKECLLLADLKKADGKDAEVRELVNEAIRIAGPGSPLIERYAAALEAGGAVITPAPKTVTKAPPPAAQQAAPRAAAPKPSETKPAPARAPEPMIATPPPKAAAPAADDLEFEIEVPDEEETPAPAAVPDFAVTTARAAAIPAAKRVEEETPDDLLGLRDPAGEDALPLPHAIPATAPSDPDGEKLGEVDFYMEQGLTDEARQVLFQLRKQYPKSRTVAERLQRLEHPQGSAAPKARQAAEESNLDLEVEQALGGRAGAPEAAGKQEPHKPAPKAAPKASKARPVFKVERHQEGHDGDFVDLAKELDASLGEEPQRHASTAPDSLEGPGHSFDEVLAAFRKGVEQQVDQEDYDTHYNLGIAYKEMGLMDEAIGEFQFAARDPSRTLECCGILGLCFRDRGMPEIALKWYRRGLDMPGLDDQRAIGLRYDMAEAYREKGDLEQALKMYTEVYGVDSNYREVAARIKEVKGHLTSSARR
jgi:tetratricopeptide (TPR) repeat protein